MPILSESVELPENRILSETYFAKREVLLRFLVRLCGDESVAEDVLQDIYLKLSTQDIHTEIREPLAFLFRMANNMYLNRLRGENSHRVRDTAWRDLHPQAEHLPDADATPSAETVVAARQELRAVMAALSTLPEKTQAIFRLHKFDGLTQPEVAKRMDVSISSVEKHLSRALKHLLALNRSRNLQ
ncbi:RNA polymerase sigma factor [Asticcacaulis sp. 201]|uniref:RNA polymerase sigma factor n=1 Tax=Asticcacaulis sp. 201 TaxID=3028787 RepID=UPI002915C66E|nr:RNA polymerase sigma factor [Asticcacaulis sp. 201]MDV6332307.1 RNA polymerase sigma factor [Asticcacaulis sp. 201]